MNMRWLSLSELRNIGFKLPKNPKNILVSSHTVVMNPHNITLGNNIRIDPWVLLSAHSAPIQFGNYIHVGYGSRIFSGGEGVYIGDYAGISSNVQI